MPSHLSEQFENFSFPLNWQKVKIDNVDTRNMSPVVAQILTRMPGRDIAIGPVHWISRATGLPTLPNSLIALDPGTMVGNGLWSEWSGNSLRTQPGWLQQWVFENRSDIFNDEGLHGRAFRAWRDRLTGPSMVYERVAILKQFRETQNNIRVRLAIVLKLLRLNKGSPLPFEGEDSVPQILDCKRALSYLSKMICDEVISQKIEDFLQDPQPQLENGDPFTDETPLFKRKLDNEGKIPSKKVNSSAAMFLSEDVLVPQDLTKFMDVELENPLEPCKSRTYVILENIKFESSHRRNFHQLNTCVTTTLSRTSKSRKTKKTAKIRQSKRIISEKLEPDTGEERDEQQAPADTGEERDEQQAPADTGEERDEQQAPADTGDVG